MIIFLHGEDEFRSLEKLNEIKRKFLEKNKDSFALEVFDFSDGAKDVEEIVLKASSGGLFSTKRLVIVKNIIASKIGGESEMLLDFLKNKKQAESKDLIMTVWEGDAADKRGKLFKTLLKISKSQEFSYLSGAKMLNWITGRTGETSGGSVTVGDAAAQRLAAYIGNDMFLLDAEIRKLVSYRDRGEIKTEDVELLVKSRVESDIFKTIDALARRDKKEALRLLHGHLESGDDPFYLLSMYFFQFRNLLKAKPFEERSVAPQTAAAELKMHPFVARKSMEQAKLFTFEKLKNLYQALCDVDYRSKTGKTDIALALDTFVAMV